MFVRLKRVVYGGKLRHYVQLVKSARENGRVKQQVVASLGRLGGGRPTSGSSS